MSKSSFYHYFESKAALFDSVVRSAMGELSDHVAAPAIAELEATGYWETIGRTIENVLAVASGDEWHADAARLFYLPDAPLADSPAAQQTTAAIRDWLVGALAVGRSAGTVRTDLTIGLQATLVADMIQSLDRWVLAHTQEYTDAKERAALGHVLTDVLKRMLAPATASG
jgi:AcrR family transcriptional regulator